MLLEHSSGWLFEQMMVLDRNPDEWKNKPVGFGDDDADEGWAGGDPDEWQRSLDRLPMHEEEVSDFGE